jgi:hypothetical protein
MAQTESSQISGSFEGRSITDIPIVAGANYSVLNLSIFLPNTTTALGGTSGSGGSFGGLRGRQNSFNIDGVDNNDPTVTSVSQQVIPNAVQQFVVNQNVFSAEYGRGSGGQVNVITKSGSNDWHLGAWLYNMNRTYNAADNQEQADISRGVRAGKRRFDFNRVGGEISGALLPRTFFLYGAYEFSNINRQATAPSGLAPTSNGMAMLNALAANQQTRDLLAQFPIAPVQNSCPGPPSCTVVVSGQSIPIGIVNSIAPDFVRAHDFLINGDVHRGTQAFHVRYLQNRVRRPFLGNFPQAQFASSSAVDNRRFILNHTVPLTASFANDFQFSFSRFSQFFPLTGIAETYPTLVISDLGSITIGPNTSIPQHRTFNQYLLGDGVTWTTGRHTVKFGGRYFWYVAPADFLQFERGFYGYSSLGQLVNDQVPTAGFQGVGNGFFAGNSNGFALFLQDDIRVTPRLTINLGLRYDFFGNPADTQLNALNAVASLPGTPLVFEVPRQDWNNIGPRLGLAWDPTGSGKWAVRSGAAVVYDWVPWSFYINGVPAQRQVLPSIQLPTPQVCLGTFGPAPGWCPTLSGFWANGAMNITFVPPSTTASARAQTSQMMSDAKAAKVFSWSVGVQREVARNTSIEVRYMGTRALELPVQLQLNSITAFENGALSLPTFVRPSEIPSFVSPTAPTLAQFSALIGTGANRRYGSQGFTGGAVTLASPVGASVYHGGSVEFMHRMSRGWYLRTNYTYSKTMDDSTNDLFTSLVNPRRPQNSYDLAAEWARSALDVRHKVAMTFLYDTPRVGSSHPVVEKTLNGWTLSGAYLFQSGQPITIQSGVDSNGNGDPDTDRVILNPTGREGVGSLVNRVCRDAATDATSINPACSAQNTVGYVAANSSAKYIQAGPGAIATLGRNTFDSPAFNTWNLALIREDAINERIGLRFSLEAYNVFNHPNFTIGNLSVFPSTNNALTQGYASLTGVSVGTFLNPKIFNGGGRQLQLSLRLSY